MSKDCNVCQDLRIPFEISSNAALTAIILLIRKNLFDGNFLDITQAAHSPSVKFSDLSEIEPWPDYVEHYFCCNSCNYQFRLAVDCYRNIVGNWEPYH